MMTMRRGEKALEREERRVARDDRERAAGKLQSKVPGLTSLSIAIRETRAGAAVSDNQYIRRIVVEHAAALFEVPCSDAQCQDGGYDVTREVLASLVAHRSEFEGEQGCQGRRGGVECQRTLHFVATATFAP